MKTLKVYDDAHTSVKVAAAQLGRTTTNIASAIIRHHFGMIERGELKIDTLAVADTDSEDEQDEES